MTQQDDAKPTPSRAKPLAIAAGAIIIAMLAVPVYHALAPSAGPASAPTIAPPVSGKITGPRPEAETAPATETPAPAEEPAKTEEPAATPAPETAPTPAAAPAAAPAAKPAPATKSLPKEARPATHGGSETKHEAKPAESTATPAPAKRDAKAAETAQSPAAPGKPAAEPRPLAFKPATEAARPEGSSVGYRVQLGLFSNLDNATALVKKLRDNGIAARTETRVSVGPFNTRAEAEEAMEKLKTLGLSPLLAPNGKP